MPYGERFSSAQPLAVSDDTKCYFFRDQLGSGWLAGLAGWLSTSSLAMTTTTTGTLRHCGACRAFAAQLAPTHTQAFGGAHGAAAVGRTHTCVGVRLCPCALRYDLFCIRVRIGRPRIGYLIATPRFEGDKVYLCVVVVPGLR